MVVQISFSCHLATLIFFDGQMVKAIARLPQTSCQVHTSLLTQILLQRNVCVDKVDLPILALVCSAAVVVHVILAAPAHSLAALGTISIAVASLERSRALTGRCLLHCNAEPP